MDPGIRPDERSEDHSFPTFFFDAHFPESHNESYEENENISDNDFEEQPINDLDYFRREFNFTMTEPTDMFRHFEEMFRGFDEVFRSMGMAEFPRLPAMPSIEQPPLNDGTVPEGERRESLRDHMLKRPDSSHVEQQQPDADDYKPSKPSNSSPGTGGNKHDEDLPATPDNSIPSFFGKLWTWPKDIPAQNPEDKLDTDLDEEVKSCDLDSIFSPRSTNKSLPPGGSIMEPHSHFHGVSVYTFKSADGKLEERRTYQDGVGNEEHTVTRGIGDQRHTVTIKRTPKGTEERTENFANMDERDKDFFDKEWQPPKVKLPYNPIDGSFVESNGSVPRGNSPSDSSKSSSLFNNLFGFHFPGFPKGGS